MQDNQARPAPSNGAHEDHVERDDYHHEEDYHHADGDYHHEEEVGGEDHHEEEDAGGEDHHDEEEDSGATPLISALRDSHVQDVIDFPCIKQPAGSIKEAFYVLHHLKGFVEDAEMMSLPPSKRDPIKMSGEINDDDLREDFHRLQMTYYVVFEGRVPGVYEEWEDCKKQVHKFSGNCYKGYPTRHEAVAKWRAHQANKSKMKTFLVLSLLLTIVAAVLYFILV
ncbi:hypothetical protein QYE76_053038 [Lolium multiflorum]|uniref:Ribonuclease H n=1 Tax=Lolium multiflorum TaxID=4521 RepID=A0AAD8SVP5_LOLMU|nr:hypothetical protein QYE76_053038 [Lolium multiflorum]